MRPTTARAWVTVGLLALLAVAGADAQRKQPSSTTAATPAHANKKPICSKYDATCLTCESTGKKSINCLTCKEGAEPGLNGKCYCLAGYGAYGTANTVRTGVTHKGGKTPKSKTIACSPCAAGYFTAQETLVRSARCKKCPVGFDPAQSNPGDTTCYVPPGYWYNAATKTITQCVVPTYCPGGDFTDPDVLAPQNCPAGIGGAPNSATTVNGASSSAQCIKAAGYYYNGANIAICPTGYWCPLGSIELPNGGENKCVDGSTTTGTGATSESDCSVVLLGYYMKGGVVTECEPDYYCTGGTTTNAVRTQCPQGTGGAASSTTEGKTGSTSLAACIAEPGTYYDNGAMKVCPVDAYCEGGPISDDPDLPAFTLCPSLTGSDPAVGTYTDSTGKSSESDCLLSPGYYCVGIAPSCDVTRCLAGDYCAGGTPVTSPGPNGGSTACTLNGPPAVASCQNTPSEPCVDITSNPGSSTQGQCYCSCAQTAETALCGTGQVFDSVSSTCVCGRGWYALPGATPLVCATCESGTRITGATTTLQQGAVGVTACNACTYGYQYTSAATALGFTCVLDCTNNSNSTGISTSPSVDQTCTLCAIGFYLDGDTNKCTLCTGNLGYGTTDPASCTTRCKENEYFDETLNTGAGGCVTCSDGRITNPTVPLTAGSTTADCGSGAGSCVQGDSVCVCGPGTYWDGSTCESCTPPDAGTGVVYKTIPKYGATSSAACSFGCAAGYAITGQGGAGSCFKCTNQKLGEWSPGSLDDPTGPQSCYYCNTPGYKAAHYTGTGYDCGATGAVGNDVCIPETLCIVPVG